MSIARSTDTKNSILKYSVPPGRSDEQNLLSYGFSFESRLFPTKVFYVQFFRWQTILIDLDLLAEKLFM